MTADRWREIEELFNQSADRTTAQREELLRDADATVRAEVEKLLPESGAFHVQNVAQQAD
jgi:hypothetical protein